MTLYSERENTHLLSVKNAVTQQSNTHSFFIIKVRRVHQSCLPARAHAIFFHSGRKHITPSPHHQSLHHMPVKRDSLSRHSKRTYKYHPAAWMKPHPGQCRSWLLVKSIVKLNENAPNKKNRTAVTKQPTAFRKIAMIASVKACFSSAQGPFQPQTSSQLRRQLLAKSVAMHHTQELSVLIIILILRLSTTRRPRELKES